MQMKKKLIPLLVVVGALSLSGCSFFSIITSDTSGTPWTGEKQTLTYTQKNLTPYAYYGIDTMPTTGNPKLLVLPIELTDSHLFINEENKEEIRSNLEKVCFGTSEETGWHSISSFYQAESYGQCVIQGEVADWYKTNYSYDAIANSTVTKKVVNGAIEAWKEANPDKVKEFDSDNNGYLDGVLAIYGGPNYNNDKRSGTKNNNMWAYTAWLETVPDLNDPMGNTFIWASYDFMEGDLSHGIIVDGHTYIHEMGHVFGLDDYYDYTEQGVWAGGFSMQDYNVGGHDPYSMMALGWVNPYVPTSSATITIKPFESSGDVILLSPDFSSNSAFDEYILVEMYSPTGVNEYDSTYQYANKYPLGPNRVGIRIWHVDARLLKIVTSSKGGDYYTVVNTIDPTSGATYVVGPTNTTDTGDKSKESYYSLAKDLRKYRLLELIRNDDVSGSLTNEALTASYLFKTGDTFSVGEYAGCFPNISRLDNGSKLNFKVKVESLTSSQAKISVTLS